MKESDKTLRMAFIKPQYLKGVLEKPPNVNEKNHRTKVRKITERINEGIATLHKLKSLIKSKGMKEPKFSMVLTGTGSFAHEEDGVFVCPLSALKQ